MQLERPVRRKDGRMPAPNAMATEEGVTPAESHGDPRAAALVTMLRLRWFIRLRWVFLAAAIVVLALERFILAHERPFGLAIVLFTLAGVNLAWMVVSYYVLRQFHEDVEPLRTGLNRVACFANAQVAADLFLLTGILRYTGGTENPLSIFYLFHMAITPLLLRPWQAMLQGVWAILLYSGLAIGEWQGWLTPHWNFLPHHAFGLYAQPMFVLANLVVVACGVCGTLYFTLQIAERLAARERQLREANAALRRSQTAIQDLQRRRSRFMQTVAHQLKGPLAVIQTLAELIRTNAVQPEAVPRTCEKIIRRCQEGIQQVGELLTLARLKEADAARHGRSNTDVREVVLELCERYQPLAEQEGIELIRRLPKEGALEVRVDPQDLSDCLGNLIDNAIKYTPGPGSVSITVSLEPSPEAPAAISIAVTDTGMGFDPEILRATDGGPGHEPVFEAFRRGNNVLTAGIPGTGLGLSIVREIVAQAGGRIRVTSRPNEGSNLTVTFPAWREATRQPPVRDIGVSAVVLEQSQPEGPEESTAGGAPAR